MWKAIKSEINYRLNTLIWIALSSLAIYIFLTSGVIFDKTDIRQLNLGLVFLIYMQIVLTMVLILKAWSKENRDRQLIILPISLRFIGMVRILLDMFIWIILIGIFLIYVLINDHFYLDMTVWLLLALVSGCALIFISLFSFLRDLVIPVKNRGSNLLIDKILSQVMGALIPGFFYILGLIQLILIIQMLKNEKSVITLTFLNPVIALAVLLSGIVLAASSIILFEKRTSYLK
ncbi:hypothetical protein ACFLRW_08080 [Acidobacteriota bacterium]